MGQVYQRQSSCSNPGSHLFAERQRESALRDAISRTDYLDVVDPIVTSPDTLDAGNRSEATAPC